jgi:hypothetical protein
MTIFARRESYMEINIPVHEEFKETHQEIKTYYHEQFSDWFIGKYLFKINEQITKNIQCEIISTLIKVRLPKHILIKYKIVNHIKNRYYLPKILYEKIKAVWREKGWAINIIDDSVYVKKPINLIHDISNIKSKFSKNYVLIRTAIY